MDLRKVGRLRLKDSRGKWILNPKSQNALAEPWQIDKLAALGYDASRLIGIRFHVANVLIGRGQR